MYCQECKTPLKLDLSLQDLNPAAFKLLTGEKGPLYSKSYCLHPQIPPGRLNLRHHLLTLSHDNPSLLSAARIMPVSLKMPVRQPSNEWLVLAALLLAPC